MMVLVDTSVWIRFVSGIQPFAERLQQLLLAEQVLAHDLVEGELRIGDRGGRTRLLSDYVLLPKAAQIAHEEVVALVKARRLHGRGIRWIDTHLAASALVERAPLWAADSALDDVARELGIAYP